MGQSLFGEFIEAEKKRSWNHVGVCLIRGLNPDQIRAEATPADDVASLVFEPTTVRTCHTA